ncbi:carbohydrate ABC transporter permease, partial [Gordonibacter pamelaeae]|nr:carbohydrate ABC transporter permease [Gordonibacter pamelaeae]
MAFTLMDKDNATLAVGLKFLMADQRSQANYGVMYAGLVIVMVPTLILYICVQKKLTQGMSLGGLK